MLLQESPAGGNKTFSIWWASDPSQMQTHTLQMMHSKGSIIQVMHQLCLHYVSSPVFTFTHLAVTSNAKKLYSV